MSQGINAIFNFITVIFVALTVVVVVVVLGVMSGSMKPPILAPAPTEIPPTSVFDVPDQPTQAFVPTFTPSTTPGPSPTPYMSPTATIPAPSSNTSSNVDPASTPAQTGLVANVPTTAPTVAPLPTLTFTPSPTGPAPTATGTLSPFPFIVQQGTPRLRENFANSSGCDWQGIAGQVIDDRGDAVIGMQVRVSGPNFGEQFTTTGTSTFYGPSGWEVAVSDTPTGDTYTVELWFNNQQISPSVDVVFTNSCQENLALVNFVQTRPF